MDLDLMRFLAVVGGAFEDFTGAMLPGKMGAEPWLAGIHRRYLEVGSPQAVRAWAKAVVEEETLAVGAMPEWIQPSKMCWPFREGRPMVYLGHVDVPDNPVSRTHASPSVRLSLFGARYPVKAGWSMHHEVLEQHPDF